ncbi:unnamed protein product [Lactuca virosa]|uniref:DUF4408 domain-containing protein n=1 Tax=Lactuca virosa TaxID=75947 RepID=A0AAU9MFZ2_9ASTR|nr:unnamed protein product [Lactuca virosa]
MKRSTKSPLSHNNINTKNLQIGVQERDPMASLNKTDVVLPLAKVVVPVTKAVEEKNKPPKAADIDQSAEEFIMKFRNQLKIQRMESIDNYNKMLARGT